MLEETYLKFKKNILPKMKKMQPNFQEPVVEYCEPEQVIDICSYNHYPILDKSSQNQRNCNDDNDIYDTSELEHEFEYGIYEDVLKTEQLMAELKRIDEAENENKKLRDDKPFFVRPYNIREDQKPIIQKEMDRLEKLGIIQKGLTGYSSPVLLVKRKQQNLYRVVTDFRVLNERLVRVNHAFPIVRDCLEAIGASKCEVMSVLDLRDAYHTVPLAEESQKYCGLTPYYGSPTYVYLRMGMGMSCSPALWQTVSYISYGNNYQIKSITK